MCTRKLGVPHVPVTVDENDLESGAKKLLKIIRPMWNAEKIEMKVGI